MTDHHTKQERKADPRRRHGREESHEGNNKERIFKTVGKDNVKKEKKGRIHRMKRMKEGG